jgi:DNA polymerase-3 subunit gamma/tau
VNKNAVGEMLGLLPGDLIKNAAAAIIKNDGPALHKVFETMSDEGFDALSLLKDLKNAFGELFYFSLNAGAEPFCGAKDIIKETSNAFIAGFTRKISKLIDEVKFSDTPLLSAEVGLFTIMGGAFDIESFIARLEALEGGTDSSKKSDGAEFNEKKTLADGQKTAEHKSAAKEIPHEQKIFSGSSDIWTAFKAELSKKHPFLHDIIPEAVPSFAS